MVQVDFSPEIESVAEKNNKIKLRARKKGLKYSHGGELEKNLQYILLFDIARLLFF